jgi:hypothetical protein
MFLKFYIGCVNPSETNPVLATQAVFQNSEILLFLSYTRGDQKYLGQNLLYENESIYKLLEVVSFKVRPSRLYAAIPAILPLFIACLVGLFGNGLQLPCRV